MQVFKKYPYLICLAFGLAASLISGCKKDITAEVKLNNVTYHLDTLHLYSSAAEKTREKTSAQFISILYTNLYQKTITSNILNDLDILTSSIGDKQMCNDLIVKSFISGTGVVIPTDAAMRANIDQFITNTYVLFYLRKPTAIEQYHFKNLIQQNTALSPVNIYTAFALSTEYQFY